MIERLRSPSGRRAAFFAALCLGLTFVPLFGSLGYENSFVLAPVLALLGMATGVDAARTLPSPGAPTRSSLTALGLASQAAASELIRLHAIAIGVLLLGRLWQPSCDPWGGAEFYVVGPVISSMLGAVSGLWGATLTTRRRRAVLLAAVPMLVTIAVGLWRLYRHPVVFAYDPFVGYFSGSIYDEAISVGTRYWRFRLHNGLAAATALLAWVTLVDGETLTIRRRAEGNRFRLVGLVVVMAGTIASLWNFTQAATRGFTATAHSITQTLSGTHETEHFIIHYAPRSSDARMIEAMATEHEFAWHELHRVMQRAPEGKIHSFIFTGPDQKRRLMGAGTVQVAAPWRNHIYLDHRGFPHKVLHHELAHVFNRTIGDPLFGVARRGLKLNIGLIEGLATALAPRPSGRLDLHDQAKVLHRLGLRPSIASIMGPGFFGLSSRVAYTTAGSFCRWLIDTRGFEAMAVLHRSAGDFELAYDTPLSELEDEWLAFLTAYEGVRDEDVEQQAQRFQRGSVFERPCAHKVAEVLSEVYRAQHKAHWDEAVEVRRRLCELEPGNPVHDLGLADGLAMARDLDAAQEVLEEAEQREGLTVTIQAAIAQRRGDVAFLAGDLERAQQAYAQARSFPLQADDRRVLTLKLMGAQDPAFAPLVRRYFDPYDRKGTSVTGAVQRMDAAMQMLDRAETAAIGHYLLGRQLLNIEDPDAALPQLQRALEHPTELPDDDFIRAARLALMEAAIQVSRFELARQTLAALEAAPDVPNGHRLVHEQWRARIAFFESRE